MQAWLWGTCESPSTALLSMTSHSTMANIPKQKPDLYKQEILFMQLNKLPPPPRLPEATECLRERRTGQKREGLLEGAKDESKSAIETDSHRSPDCLKERRPDWWKEQRTVRSTEGSIKNHTCSTEDCVGFNSRLQSQRRPLHGEYKNQMIHWWRAWNKGSVRSIFGWVSVTSPR